MVKFEQLIEQFSNEITSNIELQYIVLFPLLGFCSSILHFRAIPWHVNSSVQIRGEGLVKLAANLPVQYSATDSIRTYLPFKVVTQCVFDVTILV